MSVDHLLNRPARIHHVVNGAQRDAYNSPIPSESVTSTKVYLEQVSQGENTFARDTGNASHLCVLPANVSLDMTDRVEVDGTVYEVVGPVREIANPRTRATSHLEADLAEVE